MAWLTTAGAAPTVPSFDTMPADENSVWPDMGVVPASAKGMRRVPAEVGVHVAADLFVDAECFAASAQHEFDPVGRQGAFAFLGEP